MKNPGLFMAAQGSSWDSTFYPWQSRGLHGFHFLWQSRGLHGFQFLWIPAAQGSATGSSVDSTVLGSHFTLWQSWAAMDSKLG